MSTSSAFALSNLMKRLNAKLNVPLAPFSTLKVGGPAKFFISPKDIEEVVLIERAAFEYGLKLHILSGGSNTLFSDGGFDGIVIKLGLGFDYLHVDKKANFMNVGAGTSFAKVAKLATSLGWATAVGWHGIPGLIGGALRMNAGTRLGEIKDAILSVCGVWHGEKTTFDKKEIVFEYRKNSLPDDFIILEARLAYEDRLIEPVEQLLKKTQEYRLKRKQTQPTINSLGSFFKNPYPKFAAQLIENCNLKGLKYKGAQISPLHANFIVNNGGASANDILYIASIAQKTVFNQYGIMLCPEIKLVGAPSLDHGLCTEPWITNPNGGQEQKTIR